MDLSTAIRDGATKRPQGWYALFVTVDGVVASCAMGAAYEALTGTPLPAYPSAEVKVTKAHEAAGQRLHEAFPVLMTEATCPLHAHRGPVVEVVAHLNDEHRWTREAIADWLETL